jgi:dTMP kinase
MSNTKFVVFEGIDGCGKGTAIKFSLDYLEKKGIGCDSVRDPGSTRVSEAIREVLLNPKYTEICREAELLLYVAARAQLLAEEIEPRLNSGRHVLCDRYDLSTLTYQYVFGDWEDETPIETTTQVFIGQRKSPDYYILLDTPVDIAKKRVGKEKDRQESKGDDLFEKVRQRYLMYAEKFDNVIVVDSSGSIDDMNNQIAKVLDKIFMEEEN